MLSEFEHMPVNWVDGMKISRKHFQQEEDFTSESVKDALAVNITPFNFGILPAEKSLSLEVQCDFNQQISVQINHCNAITPNGSRIYITPAAQIKEVTHFKDIAERYGLQLAHPQTLLLLLSVNPFNRVPYGEPPVDETPPRHPFTMAEITISVLPVDQIKNIYLGNVIIIGKLSYINGELIQQKDYIPSCSAIESLPALKDWYNKFQTSISSLEHCSFKILEKIRAKGQPNNLSNCIGKIAERLAFDIASVRTYFRWILPSASPVYFCEVLVRLLHHINMMMMTFSPNDKEEVINYFTEWTDILQGNIDRQLAGALQLQYDHYELQRVLSGIYQVYNTYQIIFEKLVQLEYIGKHKGDSKIFIEQKKDTGVKQAEKSSKWSPLD